MDVLLAADPAASPDKQSSGNDRDDTDSTHSIIELSS